MFFLIQIPKSIADIGIHIGNSLRKPDLFTDLCVFFIFFDSVNRIVKDLLFEIQRVIGIVDFITVMLLSFLFTAGFNLPHPRQFIRKPGVKIRTGPFDLPLAEDILSFMRQHISAAADEIYITVIVFLAGCRKGRNCQDDRSADQYRGILIAGEVQNPILRFGIQFIVFTIISDAEDFKKIIKIRIDLCRRKIK